MPTDLSPDSYSEGKGRINTDLIPSSYALGKPKWCQTIVQQARLYLNSRKPFNERQVGFLFFSIVHRYLLITTFHFHLEGCLV